MNGQTTISGKIGLKKIERGEEKKRRGNCPRKEKGKGKQAGMKRRKERRKERRKKKMRDEGKSIVSQEERERERERK